MRATRGERSVDIRLFAGSAHPELAGGIAHALKQPLGACAIERFPDGEVSVRIDETVRGREAYFIQPTSPPADANLFELLAFADAAHRAGCARMIAVVPYFGYARADRRHGQREPITARLVADLLQAAGIDHVVTIDLHTLQVEGFFSIPVDTLTAVPLLSEHIRERLPADAVVVSPDAGRVPMATDYAQRLRAPLAVLHKQRETGSRTHVTHLVGDVADRTCLLIDDMISTGGTMVESVRALRDAGARDLWIAATHGLFLDGALDKLMRVGVDRLFVTDSVPQAVLAAVEVVSVTPLIASAIARLTRDASLRQLFDHTKSAGPVARSARAVPERRGARQH